jgi:hypothetical protein
LYSSIILILTFISRVNLPKNIKKEIEIFGTVGYKDLQECLEIYPALVCLETLHFLAAWSFDLQMEEVKQIFSTKIY